MDEDRPQTHQYQLAPPSARFMNQSVFSCPQIVFTEKTEPPQIITTAKISNNFFSDESPYISNIFSREFQKFYTGIHIE